MAVSEIPQIQKRRYRNNTSGWIGVVQLDHLGQELGVSVEPGGEVWLSDAEAILTARAPKLAEDNPFLERTFVTKDANGERREVKLTPITPVGTETRGIYGSDRYVPGVTDDMEARAQVAQAAVDGGASPVTPAMVARTEQVEQSLHDEGGDDNLSWIVPPEAPGEALPGSLPGSDEPTPAAASDDLPPIEGGGVPQAPAPAPVVAEEHAAVDPQVGEETGAAPAPAGSAVEGEYAQAEEVGTDQLGDEDDGGGLVG